VYQKRRGRLVPLNGAEVAALSRTGALRPIPLSQSTIRRLDQMQNGFVRVFGKLLQIYGTEAEVFLVGNWNLQEYNGHRPLRLGIRQERMPDARLLRAWRDKLNIEVVKLTPQDPTGTGAFS
jgi:hypothetical protein